MRLITFDLFQASANLWITFISSINIRCHLVAGKGNSMAFLIPCRHWFPHISGERRLNRVWRNRKRQSGHAAQRVSPEIPELASALTAWWFPRLSRLSQPGPLPSEPAQDHQPGAHGLASMCEKSTGIPHSQAEIRQFFCFLCFKGLSNPNGVTQNCSQKMKGRKHGSWNLVPDQQHQHHLETGLKPEPQAPPQTYRIRVSLWGWGPATCVLTSPRRFEYSYSWRITVLKDIVRGWAPCFPEIKSRAQGKGELRHMRMGTQFPSGSLDWLIWHCPLLLPLGSWPGVLKLGRVILQTAEWQLWCRAEAQRVRAKQQPWLGNAIGGPWCHKGPAAGGTSQLRVTHCSKREWAEGL